MKKLIMAKGLPASGKSTWAKQVVFANPSNVVRVNKDDLRAMLHGSFWSNSNEKQVIAIRDAIIIDSMKRGRELIIVDDTNLALEHERRLRELSVHGGYEFEVKDFTDVSLEECLERDKYRSNPVGAKVIKSMYNSFLKKPEVPRKAFVPGLPACIIVDVDGTLALNGERNPYDFTKVLEDKVNQPIADIVRLHASIDPDLKIIVFSGRDDSCKADTIEWLHMNAIPFDEIHMRVTGDHRKDNIVKQEMYDAYILDKYNVVFVLDDRNQVVTMWRENGLVCLQVANGDF